MKHRKQFVAFALLSLLSACSLDEVKDRGQHCPTDDTDSSRISYIVTGQNSICKADEACATESETFSEAFKFSVCPLAFPTCKKNVAENAWYCMEKCADGLIACDGQCIESASNPKYCGADASCSNYKVCQSFETCKDGQCVGMGCTEGEFQCSGQKLQKCEQGNWNTVEDCPKEKKCDLDKRTCEDLTCIDNTYICNENKLLRCWNEYYELKETCDEDHVCDALTGTCMEKSCKTGQVKCGNDQNVGMLKHCVNDEWAAEATACESEYSCDGDSCGECQNYDTKCVDKEGVGYLSVCVDGKWTEGAVCDGDSACNGKVCGTCVDDDVICVGSDDDTGSVIKKCVRGEYQVVDTCGDVSCHGNECGDCVNYSTKCVNKPVGENANVGFMQTCTDGKWASGAQCNEQSSCAGDECGTCVEGTETCSENGIGAVVKKCTNGVYVVVQECAGVSCNDNKCGQCKNFDTKCEDTDAKGAESSCRNGVWSTPLPCNNNASCTADGKKCGDCTNDNNYCKGVTGIGQNSICTAGKWVDAGNCQNDTSCTLDSTCGVCLTDSKLCTPGSDGRKARLSNCSNGEWTEILECGTEECLSAQECASCMTGSKICVNENGIGKMKNCVSGSWLEDSCGNVSCTNSSEPNADKCGSCKNGESSCRNVGDFGKLTQCVNGEMKESDCPNSAKCFHADKEGKATSCGFCLEKDIKCENNETSIGILSTCTEGDWVPQPCQDNNSCNPATNRCGGCHDGDIKCENNSSGIGVVSTCINGSWVQSSCDTVSCADNGCGSCKNNATKCENTDANVGVFSTCTDGIWVPQPCRNNTSCNTATNSCGACFNSDVKCEDNGAGIGVVSTCVSGKWDSSECNSVSCSGNACGSCKNRDSQCEDEDGKGKLKTCAAGAWVSSDCPNNTACKDASYCMDCIPGTESCTDDPVTNEGTYMICNAGVWNATPCYASCKDEKTCGDCTNGETQCTVDSSFQGYLKTCSAAVWPTSKTSCGQMDEFPFSAIRCYGQRCDDTEKPSGEEVTLMVPSTLKNDLETLPAKCDETALPARPEVKRPALTKGYEYVIEPEVWNIRTTYIEQLAEDTTKGINNAITWAKNKGYSRIVLPSGTYAITPTGITIPGDTAFIMQNDTILQMIPQSDEKYNLLKLNGNNIFVQGGQVIGENQSRSSYVNKWSTGSLIAITNGKSQIHIDNVKIAYGSSAAIKGDNITHLTVTNCEIMMNRFGVIYVGGSNHRFAGNNIHSNTVVNATSDLRYGFYLIASNVIIDHNIFYDNADGDIYMNSSNLFIENNQFRTFNSDNPNVKVATGPICVNSGAKSNIVIYKNVLNKANSWHYFSTQLYYNLGADVNLAGPYFFMSNVFNGGAFYVSRITGACVTENVLNNTPFAIYNTTLLRLFNNTVNKDSNRYNFKNAKGKAWDNKACATDGSSCVTGHTFESTLNDDTPSTLGSQNYF